VAGFAKLKKAAGVAASTAARASEQVRHAAAGVAEKPEVAATLHAVSDRVRTATSKATPAVDRAAGAARGAATQVAAQVSEGTTAADARPRTVRNAQTGLPVTVEAYVRGAGGGKNHAAVFPRGTKSDFGPLGNRAVGALLVVVGAPLVAVPAVPHVRVPAGLPVVRAGMYFWRKASAFDSGAPGA
jgi:hypothetical protein